MRVSPASSASAPPPCDCDSDPISCLKTMFVDMVQMGRINNGQNPARRPVFLRLHGVAHARFEVRPDLPDDMHVGIFGQRSSYPAWVRFSSDIPDGRPDLKSTVGVGIKLFDVDGEKILPPDENASTADFLFQNINVFFTDNAHDMCAFTKASLTGSEAAEAWLKEHPRTQEILDAMEQVVPTALGIDYWSAIPFHFGDERYCKYKLEPEADPGDDCGEPNYDDPDYLRADLEERLKKKEHRFRFMVQFRTDPEGMPLDRATVPWSEEESQPVHVATLVIPAQDVAARGQGAYGERLSFNPWRTTAEHAPIGSIAEARRVVYAASAELRRNVNGEPIGEPEEVRPDTAWPGAKDTVIVRAAICPGIGVARIGNSIEEDGYYIGPEVTEPPLTRTGETRDGSGAIKRQAARFRIYGYNAAGEVVKEIGADDADVEWTAHLANRKAQWYQFQAALDIPEAATMSVPLRNAKVKGDYRRGLAIDPGPRTIRGKNTSGPAYRFDSGTFQSTPVPLGELRTDEKGRLLVLGGHGKSGSPDGTPVYDPANPNSFNNADGWFDDISDGPVTATVSIAGRAIPVEPAWVITGPPNYAPDVISWRTLYDLLADAYVQCGWMAMPETISFTRDVLPALRRLSNLQWVNKGFSAMFGSGGPMNFDDPELIARLARKPADKGDPDTWAELRQVVFNAFRPANNTVDDPRIWPWMYGDAFGSFGDNAPNNNLGLSDVRSQVLSRWVHGDFINDWDPAFEPPRRIEDVPLPEQPAMLDKAALHFCLADAFHPGAELTWPMRHTSMYSAPFRIRHRPPGEPEPNYGADLTQQIALQPGGPLYAQGPGDLSRWMALPWQGDTAFCRSGYEVEYDPYLPTFWPARVPNQVLTDADYATVMDQGQPRDVRLAAFNNRANWLRALTGSPPEQMMQMVEDFGQMGIVEAREGVADDPDFPPVIFVESMPGDRADQVAALTARRAKLLRAEPTERPGRIERAGWESEEQLEQFREIRIRR